MPRNRQIKHNAWKAVEDAYRPHVERDEYVPLPRDELLNAIANKLASPPESLPKHYRNMAGYFLNYFINNQDLIKYSSGICLSRKNFENLKKRNSDLPVISQKSQ